MTRVLTWLNLAGVVTLAGLCATQWRVNRAANLRAADVERARLALRAQVAERDATIAGQLADLNELHGRLALAETQLKELDDRVTALAHERNALTAERDGLLKQRDAFKASLAEWTAAVAGRDAALKQAGEQVQTLAGERDAAIGRFNDLAGKYNGAVKDLNEARAAKGKDAR